VEFESPSDAQAAISQLNESEVRSAQIGRAPLICTLASQWHCKLHRPLQLVRGASAGKLPALLDGAGNHQTWLPHTRVWGCCPYSSAIEDVDASPLVPLRTASSWHHLPHRVHRLQP
jgi:hypothetical protein